MQSRNLYQLAVNAQKTFVTKEMEAIPSYLLPRAIGDRSIELLKNEYHQEGMEKHAYSLAWFKDNLDKAKKTISETLNTTKNKALVDDVKKSATSSVEDVTKSWKNTANVAIDKTSERIENQIKDKRDELKEKISK